jgi:hypothetical protein
VSQGDHRIEVESQEETAAEREAREQESQRHQEQLALFQKLIEDEVLPEWLLITMIELGIVTLHDDLLPCSAPNRTEHWADFDEELKLYREAPNEKSAPDASRFACPIETQISGFDEERPAPCCVARQRQHETLDCDDQPEKCAALDDPQDPVNAVQLRPCVVLGRILEDGVFIPLLRNREEAEARRWPRGKPRA